MNAHVVVAFRSTLFPSFRGLDFGEYCKNGVTDRTFINQMANYALLEWPENLAISDAPPSKYVSDIRERFSNSDWQHMQELHALPNEWESMEYPEFLEARRILMADIIRRGFETLS